MQPPQGSYPNDYDAYRPQQAADGQWTQRPLPGQDWNGQGVPGQVPPPAQIAPDPAQMPYYGAQQPGAGFGVPGQEGPWPMNGQVPPAVQQSVQPQPGPGGYQPPKTGLPRARKQKSKAGYVALTLIVLGFAAFAVLRMLAPGKTAYGYVRSGSLSARYTGDAVVVRNETVYVENSVSQIEFVAEEGGAVQRGTIVATIYTAGFNAKEWTTLKNYRNQIKEYHKVLISTATTDTRLLSYMTAVRSRALEVQRLVQGAHGNFNNQEKLLAQAMQDQQIYMKQKYPDDQKLSRLYDDENGQVQRISTWTKQYAAAADGLISFYTDGFEKALNMTTYGDFSPAEVRSMYNGRVPAAEETTGRNATDIYRMVRQEPWAVLMLCNERDWTPIIGQSYHLSIESYDNIIVTATVESFTRSGGELLVRLLIDNPSALPNVLYIRSCQVQLGENVATLMVPARAIYIQNGRKGVVMVTEGGQYWTPVEVVSDDGTTAYIVPDNAGVLYDGIPVRLF